ncbi:hypothetical protein BpHYR1_034111 [Brachionus plicatilis]|uniref:Uncharacterized protein n=1 Tax=Brachionus plicatilis TaxID=10195 RepID=A0A3M7T4Y7_BRAPC|nr:hypothetical protein BpHYR1_034111 [Brachionus plicatilis]
MKKILSKLFTQNKNFDLKYKCSENSNHCRHRLKRNGLSSLVIDLLEQKTLKWNEKNLLVILYNTQSIDRNVYEFL